MLRVLAPAAATVMLPDGADKVPVPIMVNPPVL
jgi:hypothetical protein